MKELIGVRESREKKDFKNGRTLRDKMNGMVQGENEQEKMEDPQEME